jgi:sporulation protein YqfC
MKKYTGVKLMFEWLAELTRETLYLNTSIHISGNNELIIDNCQRIEEYNEVFMRLLSGGLYINIRGSDLRAYDFRTGGLVIRGCIESIEFTERSRRHENEEKHKDKCQREAAE